MGLNFSKSSQTVRLAISSAARLSALLRTCRSSVMPLAPAAPASSASNSSSDGVPEAAATVSALRNSPWRSSDKSSERHSSSARRRSRRTAYSRSKMSRSSPCCGARSCFSTNRCISSNPAMKRSSRGERPPFFSGSAKSSSSSRSLSRSKSLIATLILVADKRGGAFCHPFFPSVLRGERGEPTSFLLEPEGAHSKLLRFFRGQARTFGGYRCSDLFQALFAHCLCENRIGFAERIDTVDQVDVEFAHIHRKPAHAVDQSGVNGLLGVVPPSADRKLLRLLCQIEGRNGVLAHGLMVFLVKLRIFLLDDLAHAHLRQLLGHQFLVKQTTLKGGLVLNEGGNNLIKILLTDARGFLALGFGEPFDLDLELPRLLVEADVALIGFITDFAVVEAGGRSALRVLWLKLKTRCKHLLHKQARRDGLQGIVHRLGNCFLGSVRLRNQVRKARAGLARCVAGCAPDDLHDFGQARPIADRQRVLAPDPVETLFRHAKRDDDVHVIPVILLRWVLQRGGNAVASGGIVI